MLLTEKIKSSYIESVDSGKPTNEHCLGRIKGVGSKFNESTRNGRRYPRELWVNVMNSDDYKEMIETRTCFGELDHPEERVDSSVKEAACVLTNMYFDDPSESLMVEMDILDTPRGRLLKELVECGCKLGVSSRGIGDEVNRNGETIIDPETYSFFAFDVVCTPAVKSARPSMNESVNYKRLSESISNEIENAKSADDLKSIKHIVEMTEMPELASITEAINIKLESYKSGDNISEKLEDDLGTLAQENERLKHELESTRSKLSANNIRLGEVRSLLKKVRESSRNLSKNLQESMRETSKLQLESFDAAVQMESLTAKYESNRKMYLKKINRINEKCHEVMDELSRANERTSTIRSSYESSKKMVEKYESQIAEMKSLHNEEVSRLKNENRRIRKQYNADRLELENKYNSDISELTSRHKSEVNDMESRHSSEMSQMMEKNSRLQSQINKLSSDKKLVENRAASTSTNMNKKLDEANKAIKNLTSDYIKTRCAQEGISVDSLMNSLPKSYTKEDVDKKLSELSDRKRRLGKMPIAMKPVTARLEENLSNMSDEDRQMYQILNNVFN